MNKYERTKSKIQNLLSEIDKSLMKPLDIASLHTGETGRLLFKINYLLYKKYDLNDISSDIQKLAEKYFEQNHLNLCSGKAGIYFFFNYLQKNKQIIDEEFLTLFDNDKETFENFSLKLVEDGDYDFLHGSLGISYVLLYYHNNEDNTFFELYFKKILNLFSNKRGIPYEWDFVKRQTISTQANLGLAHGIISILKLALLACKKNISFSNAKMISDKIKNFLISNININSISCYPSHIYFDEKNITNSRLSWCYGDLLIGITLMEYSLLFNDSDVKEFASNILHQTTTRRNNNQNTPYIINDAGLCHGTSGIAYIYKKIYHLTNESIFYDSYIYWLDETIMLTKYKNDSINYDINRSSDSISNNDNLGVLEGLSGIGLVYLNYLTDDNDDTWDTILMLNYL